MASSISNITPVHSVSPNQAAVVPPTRQSAVASKPQAAPTDTVNISAVARASSAALTVAQSVVQEAIETPAQTAREAGAGDQQARRLLAKETAK